MCHTSDFIDPARPVEIAEAGIAIRVHPTGIAGQMSDWPRAFAIDGELIPSCGRSLTAPGAFIPDIGPKARRYGLTRGLHLHRRIVGKQRLSALDMTADGVCQWFQQGRCLTNPIGQGGALQIYAIAFEDLALAIEWQVIGVLADQDVRQ